MYTLVLFFYTRLVLMPLGKKNHANTLSIYENVRVVSDLCKKTQKYRYVYVIDQIIYINLLIVVITTLPVPLVYETPALPHEINCSIKTCLKQALSRGS